MAKKKVTRDYRNTITSFSGTDIIATITPKGGSPVVIGELQTISYSIYRPIQNVFALGKIGPRGVIKGHRTIAGTLIWTVFDRHIIRTLLSNYELKANMANLSNYSCIRGDVGDFFMDEMPPFDINITFLNEYGNSSTLNIYGVTVVSEGQTMSIEDMITENTMQYIAMDMDLMNPNSDDPQEWK